MECTHSYCVFKINFLEESNKKFFFLFFHMKYFIIFYFIFMILYFNINLKYILFYVKIFETIKVKKFLK